MAGNASKGPRAGHAPCCSIIAASWPPPSRRLRGKLKYRPVVFELMAPTFTLLELQRAVEALAGLRLHKQNFRRLVAEQGLVEGTGKFSAPIARPPGRTVPLPPRSAARTPGPGGAAGQRRPKSG